MKNFVQSGEWALPVIAPAGGVAGAIVIVGSMVGVATGAASARAEVEIRPEGVYHLAKVPADALAAGALAKVDPTSGGCGGYQKHRLGGRGRRGRKQHGAGAAVSRDRVAVVRQ